MSNIEDRVRDALHALAPVEPGTDRLVSEALRYGVRARRRRIAVAVVATVAVVVGSAAAIGSLYLPDRGTLAIPMAPSSVDPSPVDPSPVDPRPIGGGTLGVPRALTYAEGDTIHFGDETFDAGAEVVFVEATDDGVVFITAVEQSRPAGGSHTAPLWFTDGSDVEQIGVVDVHHVHEFRIATSNPGSLVAWVTTAATDPASEHDEEIEVYDTRQRTAVARIPAHDPQGTNQAGLVVFPQIRELAVTGTRVYWEDHNPTDADGNPRNTGDRNSGDVIDADVNRYDVTTGVREVVSWDTYHADLVTNPRMLSFGNASTQVGSPPPVVAQRLAAFMREGDELVPTTSIHYGTEPHTVPTTRMDGQPVQLRLPEAYTTRQPLSFVVVQWLDDITLVLFAFYSHDEFPTHKGDFLTCDLSTGICSLVVPASSIPYLPPGEIY